MASAPLTVVIRVGSRGAIPNGLWSHLGRGQRA